ncbi:Aminotransferase class-III OS=Tsukamurella paurometabola (strain ATCC 8368 / DSM / CCUG 35730/ CIP 100753 / JCM 10117 / KCTC 9821 / NBRC 16120 / NCIMB 702349 / NCTC 13040) OX=521096 GN=Tpau_0841 PE=3 SV=1 [Tsukamurella paurometabola]|uniref:Aminotransferase class-III n=1 Tax=Tsukamurella paurometabola (strain ATCC 8368 / DSM 20162 / CCUG 35730 / CIP 100753 / JCM 10117 / KCTC 9821 / NBRC 16120 / NCIMB 702349 / NCTC 13040) TaxID=521096 RepID=D5UTX2_TSUPD|nr:aspartate aminotransferase family protein [Tsukamurella paurometabola]ADG77476.1 aminotransferase class-III [Tsukamurella paurometabola DSM 20162]SUP27308.1 Taurine--pyruvate aminotransferase [Tsukamurella paurometabola]
MAAVDTADLDRRAYQLDRDFVFHSWSAQAALTPMVIAGGQGSRVWDHAGRSYLDFSSQLVDVNLGHQHPKMVRAIADQAAQLCTVGPSTANLARGEAARRIVDLAPEGLTKVFFTNGGADAIENAIRMARLHTGRSKVLSAYRSYHGNTGAAVVATGDWRRLPNEYATGHAHFHGPYLYRSEFWAQAPEQECDRALAHLERTVAVEGPDSVAAILLESVPGTAGVLVPPPGYLAGVREIADRHSIVLILDEVMAGFGRTGAWFAHTRHGVRPDLITFAKGVNSGYVPVGGVVIGETIAKTFDDRVFPGGLTYSGHPLACASIVAALDTMAEEGVVDNAARIGRDVLGPALRALAADSSLIGEVRGEGVFWALELVEDRATRVPLSADRMARIKADLIAAGLLPMVADNRIHVVPPCTVTDDEVAEAIAIYRSVLTQGEQR